MNRRGFLATLAAVVASAWRAHSADLVFPQIEDSHPFYEFGANVTGIQERSGGLYVLTEDSVWYIDGTGEPAKRISRTVSGTRPLAWTHAGHD